MDERVRKNPALFSSVTSFDPGRISVLGDRSIEKREGAITNEDGSMSFSFYAPDAKSVAVHGVGGTFANEKMHEMQKEDSGWWSVTVTKPDIEEGFHYHEYYVNGVRTLNPAVPVGYGCGEFFNVCDTADAENTFYLLKNVPHGTVRMDLYPSEVCARTRNCMIYLPPSYSSNTEKRYPVWYLHHGGGENEIGWVWQGKINLILDNLIAEGKCEEMIVVMNSTDAFAPTEEDEVFKNVDYSDVIVKDCVPYIDANYRTIPDGDHRAIAGLSMGVVYSYMASFKYPEVFKWIGFFSGHIMIKSQDGMYFGRNFDNSAVFADKELFNERIRLMFHAGGIREGFGTPREIPGEELPYDWKKFMAAGYHVEGHPYRGFHEWDTWRFASCDFAQKIFKGV